MCPAALAGYANWPYPDMRASAWRQSLVETAGSIRRVLAAPGKPREGGHSRAGCPGARGIPAPAAIAPTRRRRAHGGGGVRWPSPPGSPDVLPGRQRDPPSARPGDTQAQPPDRASGQHTRRTQEQSCDDTQGAVAVTGNRIIRGAVALAACTVTAIAAMVSYSDIYHLGRDHGQDERVARLVPLSLAGLIVAACLALLHETRNGRTTPLLPKVMLRLGFTGMAGADTASSARYWLLGAAIGALAGGGVRRNGGDGHDVRAPLPSTPEPSRPGAAHGRAR